VMRGSSRMLASTRCSVSGLAAVTGRPERGKSRSSAFHVPEAVTRFAQRQEVLLLTVALL
jgi:hypothetical protein